MRKRTRLGWAWLMLSLFVVAGSAHAAPGVGNNRGAWLGIYSQTLTTELRDGLDYRGSGVLVNRVVSDSPADQAGLEKGDIILSVNSNSVESPEDLSDAIQSHQPGDAVKLEIVRDGDRRSITANLSARNSDDGGDMPGMEDDAPRSGHDAPNTDDDRIHIKREIKREMKDKDDDSDQSDLPNVPSIPGFPNRVEMRRMMRDHQGSMKTFTMPGHGRLGVRIQDLSTDLKDYFDTDRGALVTEVIDDTPAARAGLKAGDVITRVDGTRVENSSDLVTALRGRESHVTVEYLRHGARRSLDVTLDSENTQRGDPGARVYQWRGNGMGNGVAPRAMIMDQRRSSDDLEREVTNLREEIRQLRRELDDMKHGNNK